MRDLQSARNVTYDRWECGGGRGVRVGAVRDSCTLGYQVGSCLPPLFIILTTKVNRCNVKATCHEAKGKGKTKTERRDGEDGGERVRGYPRLVSHNVAQLDSNIYICHGWSLQWFTWPSHSLLDCHAHTNVCLTLKRLQFPLNGNKFRAVERAKSAVINVHILANSTLSKFNYDFPFFFLFFQFVFLDSVKSDEVVVY